VIVFVEVDISRLEVVADDMSCIVQVFQGRDELKEDEPGLSLADCSFASQDIAEAVVGQRFHRKIDVVAFVDHFVKTRNERMEDRRERREFALERGIAYQIIALELFQINIQPSQSVSGHQQR
jgi:hypothetical protein